MASRYKTLFEEIENRRPSTILEIGTWNAANSLRFIKIAKKYHDDVFYYGFDMFEQMTSSIKTKEVHAKKNVSASTAIARLKKITNDFQLIIGNTNQTLQTFTPDRQLDFVFIDGGHSVETIKNDWSHISKWIDCETVVIFDDYYDTTQEGCKEIVDSLSKDLYAVSFPAVIEKHKDRSVTIAKVTKK